MSKEEVDAALNRIAEDCMPVTVVLQGVEFRNLTLEKDKGRWAVEVGGAIIVLRYVIAIDEKWYKVTLA